jgi:hypothetical protein
MFGMAWHSACVYPLAKPTMAQKILARSQQWRIFRDAVLPAQRKRVR